MSLGATAARLNFPHLLKLTKFGFLFERRLIPVGRRSFKICVELRHFELSMRQRHPMANGNVKDCKYSNVENWIGIGLKLYWINGFVVPRHGRAISGFGIRRGKCSGSSYPTIHGILCLGDYRLGI